MKPPDPRYNIIQKIEATGGSAIENDTQHVTIERTKLDRVFLAPPLPPHFVTRLDVSAELKARVMEGAGHEPGMLAISAVHGLGGIGKSTLAAAMAHVPELQERFSDGILWV